MSFNFMAVVTSAVILEPPKIKSDTVSTVRCSAYQSFKLIHIYFKTKVDLYFKGTLY